MKTWLALTLLLLASPALADEIVSGPMTPIPQSDDPTQGYTIETRDDQPTGPVNLDLAQTAACGVMTGRDPVHAKGIEAYQAGDYPEALILFIRESAAGDGQAAYMLGHMQAVGLILPQDYDTARAWFERAAARGSTKAEVELAVQKAYGLAGFKPDPAGAIKDLQNLLPDQPLAGFWLGKMLIGTSPADAVQPLKIAADGGHRPAIGLLIDGWCRAGTQAKTGLSKDQILAYFAAAHLTLEQDPGGWAALPCADRIQPTEAEKSAALAEGKVIRGRFPPQDLIW